MFYPHHKFNRAERRREARRWEHPENVFLPDDPVSALPALGLLWPSLDKRSQEKYKWFAFPPDAQALVVTSKERMEDLKATVEQKRNEVFLWPYHHIIENQRWKFKSRSGLILRKDFKSWRWAQNCSTFAGVGKCSKLQISHSGGSTTSPTSTTATSSSSTKVFSILSCETLQSERQKGVKTRAERWVGEN